MAEDPTHPGVATQPIAGSPPVTDAYAVQGFHLHVVSGVDAGARFRLAAGERARVGTHASCELVLTDATVSRFHCEIVVAAAGATPTVRDLDSRNGTKVDGTSVLHAHLHDGATVVLGRTALRFELARDPVKLPVSAQESFGTMVARSLPMRRVFAHLEGAAASDATVLLEGETGTGKELAAESLHRASARRDGPFVVVDCGAIPANLLESELFGHARGAFTGAVTEREGAFEAASGGTIFLDEIGELDAELQPALLRALERREVKRVGGNRWVPVDVRVIAATNRSLKAEVNQQRFRADLYYRLAVLEIRLPPLREHPEDLPFLVEHVLRGLGAAERPEAEAVRAPEFLAALARHGWPGNVRELRNYVERCLAMREAPVLEPPAAAGVPRVDLAMPLRAAREAWLRPFEREYLEGLLARHDGNVSAASRAAGVDRITFYRMLWRHGLR